MSVYKSDPTVSLRDGIFNQALYAGLIVRNDCRNPFQDVIDRDTGYAAYGKFPNSRGRKIKANQADTFEVGAAAEFCAVSPCRDKLVVDKQNTEAVRFRFLLDGVQNRSKEGMHQASSTLFRIENTDFSDCCG